MTLLLDTHVIVWWVFEDQRLGARRKALLDGVGPESPARVSDISVWEIANLVSLGRLELDLPLGEWLRHATAPPLVERIGITPQIAAEVARLPDSFHRDPADRIIVATARILGATLLTDDKQIRSAKLVATV